MAGGICAVYKCFNYTISNCSKSFFRFPKDRDTCQKWVYSCRRDDLDKLFKKYGPDYMYRSYKICSDHFTSDCFRNPKLASQGLLPGSLPTQKLFFTKPQKPCRASPKKRLRSDDVAEPNNIPDIEADTPLPDARLPKWLRVHPEQRIKLLQQQVKQQQKKMSRLRKTIRKMSEEISCTV